jgi:glycine/D-amino acid oxidase-like deaminating enzyme
MKPDRHGGDIFTSDFRTDACWLDDVSPPEADSAPLPTDVDVLIIGAGYTGLSAAIQTARGGRSTLVIDAERAGWGCSTRNGGQISTSIKPGYEELCRRYGSEKGFAIAREGHNSLAWVGEFITSEGLDCDFEVSGRFHAAHNPRRFRLMAEAAASQPKGLEKPVRVVSRAEQRSELGTDVYHGGIVNLNHACLHPAKFHRELLRLAHRSGAEIVSYCRAEEIERSGGGFDVKTSRGIVRARDVVVATNGYTGGVTPWQRRRVIPIGSYIIATEELAPELLDRLMPTRRVITDSRKVVYYYRPSPDRKRIVFGGRVTSGEIDPKVSAYLLREELARLFPELADVRVSHSWVGFVAYTFDELPHVGIHDGVRFAMGYCGSGVGMSAYLGMRTGQQILGLEDGRTAFDDIPFPTRPFYSGNPWFLGAAVGCYRMLDRTGY